MMIQFILIFIFACTLIFAFTRSHKAPFIGWSVILLSFVGIGFVLFPQTTQTIAYYAGVGRGADLITYIFISIMLMVILDMYLRLRALLDMLTAIVRHMSLAEADKRDTP